MAVELSSEAGRPSGHMRRTPSICPRCARSWASWASTGSSWAASPPRPPRRLRHPRQAGRAEEAPGRQRPRRLRHRRRLLERQAGPLEKPEAYRKTFQKNLDFCKAIGIPCIRVDTVTGPPGPAGKEREDALLLPSDTWNVCAEIAAKAKVKLTWEFEPGFAFNKPSRDRADGQGIDHPNFGILFDACHAHMVRSSRHVSPQPKENAEAAAPSSSPGCSRATSTTSTSLIPTTPSTATTSTHRPFGEGVLDFDKSSWPSWPRATRASGGRLTCASGRGLGSTEAAKKFLEPYIGEVLESEAGPWRRRQRRRR